MEAKPGSNLIAVLVEAYLEIKVCFLVYMCLDTTISVLSPHRQQDSKLNMKHSS